MSSTITATEALLYALIVGGPLLFGCVEPWSQALLELACYALALACLFRPERGRPSRGPLIALAAVLAVGAAQWLHPIGPLDPRPGRPFTVSAYATGQALLLWSAYAALAWSAPRVVADIGACRRFLRAVVASGAGVAALGLAQALFGMTELYGVRYVREDATPFGPFYDRDHAAALMAISCAVAAGVLYSRMRQVESSWRTPPPDWLRAQAGTAGALALLIAGLVACGSRGAWLGLGTGAAAAAFLAAGRLPGPRRVASRLAILALAAGAVGASILAFERGVALSGTIDVSTAGRLSLYRSGLAMLRDSPLFGWGLGAVGAAFGSYQQPDVFGPALYVHNDWLQSALECGLAGAALAAAGALLFGRTLLRVWRSARSREARALIAGALAAIAAFAAHCLVDFCSRIPADAAVAVALVGWLSGAAAWADKRPPPAPRPARWRLAFAPALLVLGALALRPLVGAWYERRAALAPAEARAPLLLRAAAWDPRPKYSFLIGVGWLDAGRLDAALEQSSAALRAEPLNPDFLSLQADILDRLGRKAESRDCFERAQRMRFEPPLPDEATAAERRQDDLETLQKLELAPLARR